MTKNLPKIYTPNVETIEKYYKDDYKITKSPECNVYENVVLEPLKRSVKGKPVSYEGGVCHEDGKFIAGFYRDPKKPDFNRCVFDSYKPEMEKAVHLEGEYILGGFLVFVEFAHFCTDDMTRLWYIAKNYDKIDPKTKVVFFAEQNKFPSPTVEKLLYSVMELLGIGRERIIIVDKLYKVDKIYVPDQSFSFHGGYTDEYKTVYKVLDERAMERAPEGKIYSKKVYLTRSQYSAQNCVNEDYFEKIYRKQGYYIFAPETVPIDEQIRVMYNAEEVACLLGSATYLNSFSINIKKLTLMLRDGVSEYFYHASMARYFQAYSPDFSIVDVSMNYLPTKHTGGVFLLGPTKYWKAFLDDNNFIYDDDDLKFDWSVFPEYAEKYLNNYTTSAQALSFIKNYDIFDDLQRLSYIINDAPLDRSKLNIKSKSDFEKEIKNLEAKVASLTKKNTQLTSDQNKLITDNNELSVLAAKKQFCMVPEGLKIIVPSRKKPKCLKLQSGKSFFVNGEERKIDSYLPKIHEKYGTAVSEWGCALVIAYTYMFEKKYDLIFCMPENCDILFGSEDLCRLNESALGIVFGGIRTLNDSIAEYYSASYGADEWNNILGVIGNLPPEQKENANKLVNNRIVFSANKFIAKQQVFNSFTPWLLASVDEIFSKSSDKDKLDISEISEILLTAYFMSLENDSIIGIMDK